MPLSDFLTLSTSKAWASTDIFLWIMPMPPSRAMQIAVLDSVTESIAALSSGVLSFISFVNQVERSTWFGRTLE